VVGITASTDGLYGQLQYSVIQDLADIPDKKKGGSTAERRYTIPIAMWVNEGQTVPIASYRTTSFLNDADYYEMSVFYVKKLSFPTCI